MRPAGALAALPAGWAALPGCPGSSLTPAGLLAAPLFRSAEQSAGAWQRGGGATMFWSHDLLGKKTALAAVW